MVSLGICEKCGAESDNLGRVDGLKDHKKVTEWQCEKCYNNAYGIRSDRIAELALTKDKKIIFNACIGDSEISIKVGKEGLSKLLSIFMEV